MKKTVDPVKSNAAAILGSKGGKSGKGDSKRRDSAFYTVTLPAARRRAAEKRAKEAAKAAKAKK